MSFLDLAGKRRSVRSYSPDPIPREAVERCLEAARLAPSACNSQPWQFIVVDRPELREQFTEAAFSGLHSMNSFAKAAPVHIAVVRESAKPAARFGGFFRGVDFTLIDIGIACEHLVLQAAEEDIGSCYFGWFDEKGVKRMLGLPRGSRVDLLICLGYTDRPLQAPKQRKAIDEIRSYA
ncbi:MAG: nitroreductase family protein [Thermovirgaceae bacterium]|nr:nitroreductase family protein [Thermovirgaceae bacterium]